LTWIHYIHSVHALLSLYRNLAQDLGETPVNLILFLLILKKTRRRLRIHHSRLQLKHAFAMPSASLGEAVFKQGQLSNFSKNSGLNERFQNHVLSDTFVCNQPFILFKTRRMFHLIRELT
jgi:hypothetical protein